MRSYVFQHNDFGEFLRICSEGPSEMRDPRRTSRRVESESSPWSGTWTFQEALNLAVEGCPELEDQIVRVANKILARMGLGSRDYSPVAFYDVAGDEVDVSRYLEGEPECMRTWQTQEVWRPGGRIISMTAQCSIISRVTPELLRNRGAAMLAFVYAAEQAGYRVELDAAFAFGGDGASSTIIIRLKDADRPVDLSRLAFMLMHPASTRRLRFAYQECQSAEYRSTFWVGSGYGRTTGHGEICALQAAPPADILLAGEWQHFASEETAVAWALREAEKLGLVEPETIPAFSPDWRGERRKS